MRVLQSLWTAVPSPKWRSASLDDDGREQTGPCPGFPEKACLIIHEAMTRPPNPAGEVEVTVAKAYREVSHTMKPPGTKRSLASRRQSPRRNRSFVLPSSRRLLLASPRQWMRTGLRDGARSAWITALRLHSCTRFSARAKTSCLQQIPLSGPDALDPSRLPLRCQNAE